MKRWVQHPPSARRVRLVLGVAALALSIALIQHYWGWPEWATLNPERQMRFPRP